MTLTNHLLTGSLLAKLLPLPLAILLAFCSHFVLDALPHFGLEDIGRTKRRKTLWVGVLVLDAIVAISLAIWLVVTGHYTWLLTGLVAFSPDLAWIYRFIFKEGLGKSPLARGTGNRLSRFHANIQKYERGWGGIVEVVYAIVIFSVIR